MKAEWIFASLVSVVTLLISLLLVRYLAPGLLGIPIDLQMVKVSEEIPAFFENAFGNDDLLSSTYLIKDPITGVRALPLFPNAGTMGPNDMLGFRNLAIPVIADIVTIGDSQTYGNNSPIQLNWPSQLSTALNKSQKTEVYNMSVGGWGAVQYLYAATNATLFQPRVLIIAFYTGNDPLESFNMAYNYDIWNTLIPDSSLSASDIPDSSNALEESAQWPVTFSDGTSTTFTPKWRYLSNQDHPAVRAGYSIMANVADDIVTMVRPKGISVVFTIIPTKELVYETKLTADSIDTSEDYDKLIHAEKANIEQLEKDILKIEDALYVDVVGALQNAALDAAPLYLEDSNGHPIDRGYQVIADALAPTVQAEIPDRPTGLALIQVAEDGYKSVFIEEGQYWHFSKDPGISTIERYGRRLYEAPLISARDIADLNYAGLIPSMPAELPQ